MNYSFYKNYTELDRNISACTRKGLVLVLSGLEYSSIWEGPQIFFYRNEDFQCKWPPGLGAIMNCKSCCRSSCPAALYSELDLGLDFTLFVDASEDFTWQLVDIFDSVCSAISEILVSAPCTRPYYVPCLWSSLIACCFWYDLKIISMTENRWMVKEEAPVKISSLFFCKFHDSFHTHYKETQGYVYKWRSEIKWSPA